jgi:hypothetical protein
MMRRVGRRLVWVWPLVIGLAVAVWPAVTRSRAQQPLPAGGFVVRLGPRVPVAGSGETWVVRSCRQPSRGSYPPVSEDCLQVGQLSERWWGMCTDVTESCGSATARCVGTRRFGRISRLILKSRRYSWIGCSEVLVPGRRRLHRLSSPGFFQALSVTSCWMLRVVACRSSSARTRERFSRCCREAFAAGS